MMLISVFSTIASAVGEEIGVVPSLLVSSGKQNGLYEECTLGDALADAMVRFTEADIAIVNGGCLKANIIQGSVTKTDITDAIEDGEVAVVTVTSRELFNILEECLCHVMTNGDGSYDIGISENALFPQISGFRLTYDPAAEPYTRISRITINDKNVAADDSNTWRLAVPAALLNGEFFAVDLEPALRGETLVSLMEQYISSGMDDYYTPPKRIIPQGIHSSVFPDRYAVITILIICALFVVLYIPLGKKLHLFEKRSKPKKQEKESDV